MTRRGRRRQGGVAVGVDAVEVGLLISALLFYSISRWTPAPTARALAAFFREEAERMPRP